MATLEEGKKAPAFTLPTDGDGTVSLKDFKGQNVVVYFYPKDDTPGCTKQAIGFTELQDAFAEADTQIIGISKDPVAKHDKFKAKHDLGIILASDADSDVTEKFGSWVEKSMYGKTYMGIDRSTFLIDGTGKIRQIWRKVRVKDHVAAVLEAAKAL
ncbi:MAG: thioredoxin-dependent thiol peroxidase [Pseudomonadota bacterium]